MAEEPPAVAVVGLGTIGHSLAQMFAAGGCAVRCYDPDERARATLRPRVDANLAAMCANGLADADGAAATAARLRVCDSLAAALEGASVVCESSLEDLAVKQALFAEMEGLVDAGALLTSTTSSFPIGQIAARLAHPERCLVLHPFNPPHLIPVVEVVGGARTSEPCADAAVRLLRRVGKTPIRLRKECPGFVVNRIQLAMLRECWSLLDAGVASAEDIDAAVRGTLGLRLAAVGPLRVCDFAGLDVWSRIFAALAPDLAAGTAELPPALAERVAAGALGTKSGAGFYDYAADGELARQQAQRDAGYAKVVRMFHQPEGG